MTLIKTKLILIKRWENHINIYATFVDDDNIDNSHTYKKVPCQYPQDNIPNGMYDLSDGKQFYKYQRWHLTSNHGT
jgi:hypothetical protein